MRKMVSIQAPVISIMAASDTPESKYAYSPGICVLPDGRLVGSMDYGGPAVTNYYGEIYLSDDNGLTWRKVHTFDFCHARPFTAGDLLYVIGHRIQLETLPDGCDHEVLSDLCIICSADRGEHWSETAMLTHGKRWHQAPSNVLYRNGSVYLVMEEQIYSDIDTWAVSTFAPVLMRACVTDNLLYPESWTFADRLPFRDAVDLNRTDLFGIPFYPYDRRHNVEVGGGRCCEPLGWLETNVVCFNDPRHVLYQPNTLYLWMRAHTGLTGYAAIAKVTEQPDGSMTTSLVQVPSGRTMVYVPCPGGQMKFHILYDEISGYYWLLSTQATDSMIRPDCMPQDRWGLPNNERQRLQLFFSKNCWDWCFAALIDRCDQPNMSRQYASMIISGDDLCILCRSGDERARNAHNSNMITFSRIHHFRELLY